MSDFWIIVDTVMCIHWMITYTLVFVSTWKYKYPTIHPMTSVMIGSFEAAVAIRWIVKWIIGSARINYAVVAYSYWALLEVATLILIIKLGHVKKKHIVPYILTGTALVLVSFTYLDKDLGMLYGADIHTTIGMFFWLVHMLNPKYPITPMTLIFFWTKFFADLIGGLTYFRDAGVFIAILSFLIPALDLLFFVVAIFRKKNEKKYVELYNKAYNAITEKWYSNKRKKIDS